MKPQIISLVAALTIAPTLFAAPPTAVTAPVARVEVVFDQPEKFTDVKDSSVGSDKGRDEYLTLIKEYLEERVPYYLGAGQTLKLIFTDIDLAGDFEPWRGPDFSDVRIVKDIYPPRMSFSCKLVDANGAVVKEGQEKLVEMSFQMLAGPSGSSDSLRYEKAMLDNWLRNKIQPLKAASAKK